MNTRLQDLMSDMEWSKADLAHYMGVSEQSVAHYLSGAGKPSISKIYKLQKYFDEKEIDMHIMDIFMAV